MMKMNRTILKKLSKTNQILIWLKLLMKGLVEHLETFKWETTTNNNNSRCHHHIIWWVGMGCNINKQLKTKVRLPNQGKCYRNNWQKEVILVTTNSLKVFQVMDSSWLKNNKWWLCNSSRKTNNNSIWFNSSNS